MHIQESKAASCDIQPGRRPRGPELLTYVEEYRRRAGVRDRRWAEQRQLSPDVHAAELRT